MQIQQTYFFFNPWLFFMLKDFDIIHTTDQFFSMMKTGSFASKFWKIPMTTSIHTDTPPYTKYYVSKIIKNLNFFGIDKVLINKLKIPEFFERKMFAKIYKYIKLSKHAFVADKIYSPEFVIQLIFLIRTKIMMAVFIKNLIFPRKINFFFLVEEFMN